MLIADDWGTLALRVGVATLAGALLGLDREWRGHDAGIRTNALVALSAAMVTVSSLLLFDQLRGTGAEADPLRVVQGIAQAIGFIAAGLIFVRRGDVQNITTAANLWVAAAAGIVAGLGQYRLLAIAAGLALVLLLSNGLVRKYVTGRGERSERLRDRPPPR